MAVTTYTMTATALIVVLLSSPGYAPSTCELKCTSGCNSIPISCNNVVTSICYDDAGCSTNWKSGCNDVVSQCTSYTGFHSNQTYALITGCAANVCAPQPGSQTTASPDHAINTICELKCSWGCLTLPIECNNVLASICYDDAGCSTTWTKGCNHFVSQCKFSTLDTNETYAKLLTTGCKPSACTSQSRKTVSGVKLPVVFLIVVFTKLFLADV